MASLGYRLFGTLEGYPPQHRQSFLVKRINAGPRPGLLNELSARPPSDFT